MNKELKEMLNHNGYLDCRETPHGIVGVRRFMFTVAIMVNIDWAGYSHRYCYDTAADCLMSLESWEKNNYKNEPEDYIVRKGLGPDKQGIE